MKTTHYGSVVRVACALMTILLAVPALAQTRDQTGYDFSGDWAPIRQEDNFEGSHYPGQYVGVPINEANRVRGDTWSPSWITLPEWQCRPHGTAYIHRDPSSHRYDFVKDPITRETVAIRWNMVRGTETWIYLDGRPHPGPNAPHTWNGFSTGEWIGDTLRVRTTHLKENVLKRQGLAVSDQAEVVRYFRRDGDILSITIIIYDPVYLTEPYIATTAYRWTPERAMGPYPCNSATEIVREKGEVPHILPGDNRDVWEFSYRFQVPLEASRGGAETMYPDLLEQWRNGEPAPSRYAPTRDEAASND